MPSYVIEREIPDACKLTPPELQAPSRKCGVVLQKLGLPVPWRERFVTDDNVRPTSRQITARPMKRWHWNTPAREVFRQIAWQPSGQSLVLPRTVPPPRKAEV